MLNRVADRLYPIYENIKEDIANSKVVGSDETGTNVKSDIGHGRGKLQQKLLLQFLQQEDLQRLKMNFPKGFPMRCWCRIL